MSVHAKTQTLINDADIIWISLKKKKIFYCFVSLVKFKVYNTIQKKEN